MEDYAYDLMDIYGNVSGYRRYKDEVAYIPPKRCPSDSDIFRRTKIDVNTMVVLGDGYIKDSARVYKNGILLKGISAENFRVINGSFIGNEQIVYSLFGDAKIAHPESFEVLDAGAYKDDGKEFPDGFSAAEKKREKECLYHAHSYARDEEFAYFFTSFTSSAKAMRIKACHDPKALEIVKMMYMYAAAKDKEHVYYDGVTVKKADPESFEYIGSRYARDSRHIFFHSRIVEGADPDSFKILYAPDDIISDAICADKNNYYRLGDIIDEYEAERRMNP